MKSTITILLIEDSPVDAELIQTALEMHSSQLFIFRHADRLSEIPDLLKQGPIDIVLLDLDLPDSRGLDTFLSTQEFTDSLPIIVISGMDDELLSMEAMRNGAQDYLVKGKWDTHQLVRSILSALGRQGLVTALAVERTKLAAQYQWMPAPSFTWEPEGDDFVLTNFNRAARPTVERMAMKTGDKASQVFSAYPETFRLIKLCAKEKSTIVRRGFTTLLAQERRYLITTFVCVAPQLVLLHVEDVTEQKRAEKALKATQMDLERRVERRTIELSDAYESLQAEFLRSRRILDDLALQKLKFETLVENVPFGITTSSADGKITYMNSAFREYCGYGPEDFTFEAQIMEKLRLVDENGRPLSDSAEMVCKDGSIKIMRFKRVTLQQGDLITSYEDVTKSKRDEQALRESEERYRLLFETSGDPLLILKADEAEFGNIIRSNKAAQELYGYSEEQFRLLRFGDLGDPEAKSWLQEVLPKITAGHWIKKEFTHLKRDGSHIHTEFLCGVIRSNGERFIFASGRDNTDKNRMEQLLFQAERLQAVSELAGGVAHNFNNMLQIIVGGVQLAELDVKIGAVDAALDSLKVVLQSAHAGAETVKRLQSFARLRSSGDNALHKPFDLTDTIRQAIDLTTVWWKRRPETPTPSIEFQSDLEPGCMVLGIEGQMFEAAVNLIKNAVEALPHGGSIDIRTYTCEDEVRFTLKDTGVGIEPGVLKKIFQPFFTTKGVQSTGTGLAGVYGVIKNHNGCINVTSEPGKGTEFSVALAKYSPFATSSLYAEGLLDIHANILVIHDVPSLGHMLKEALTRYGQTVALTDSGPSALEIPTEEKIDLVLCDLASSQMDGWTFGEHLQKLCRKHEIAKPPVILFAGEHGGSRVNAKPEKGIDAVLPKPIALPELFRTVRQTLNGEAPYTNAQPKK